VAYNTKKIKRDVDGNPVPQIYNPATEEYEVLQGGSGASRHMLYSPDGVPVDTTGNKLGVRDDEVAQALAALLTQLDTTGVKKIIDALPAGNNKIGKVDVEASALPAGAATEAKQMALQNALNALIGEVQANPTANTILGRMKSLESKIDTLDEVIDSILAKIIASPATEAKQDTLISHVDGVEAALATLLTKAGFDAKADISLTALRDALRGTGSKTLTDLANALVPLATAAKQDTLAGLVSTAANQTALQNLIGSLAAAAVTDPTASAALIQLLKGLLKQLQGAGTGAAPVQLTGSIETVVDNPATGIKTITTTAAELFAGAYAKTNRRKLIIKNEDQSLRFRIGKADITQQNGFPVEPGAVVIIPFDPAVMVPIYAISEGASLQASVMEV